MADKDCAQRVADSLTYEDLGRTHEWRTFRDMQREDEKTRGKPGHQDGWFVSKYGLDALDAKVASLHAERWQKCLVADDRGAWTYSGLAPMLAEKFGARVRRAYPLPALTGKYAHCRLPFALRPLQEEVCDLFQAGSALGPVGAELATGIGKTAIFLEAIRRCGLPALVTTMSLSISGQFYRQAVAMFGKAEVGRFFDGKKELDRPIVIATTASVARASAAATDSLREKLVLLGDESHLLAAETLSQDIFGKLGDIPYRFFLSGSQIRGDGADLLLEGVLGRVVKRVTVRDGVEMGYLARPNFVQVRAQSPLPWKGRDVVKLNRLHLHQNEAVADRACAMVRTAVAHGRRVLVAIDELTQFRLLEPRLRGLRVALAHGGIQARDAAPGGDLEWLPPQHRKSDPPALVEALDRGEYDVMVGTSCIGTGTDFQTVDFVVDLCGLASEVRIRQLTGRATRIAGGKTDFYYVDFDVANVEPLTLAAAKRRRIFEEIFGPVTVTN